MIFSCRHLLRLLLPYKLDERDEFTELTQEVFARDFAANWESASPELRLAAGVAEFAEILSESFYAKGAKLEALLEELESISPYLQDKKVKELITLVKKTIELKK
ncbi:MAG: DUF3520 domain-containing protein [Planctomycetes bacterium]|nr:DUF3520 domain-containing protein [Planctomycetota bacterium]